MRKRSLITIIPLIIALNFTKSSAIDFDHKMVGFNYETISLDRDHAELDDIISPTDLEDFLEK